jgi:hypothetical protein
MSSGASSVRVCPLTLSLYFTESLTLEPTMRFSPDYSPEARQCSERASEFRWRNDTPGPGVQLATRADSPVAVLRCECGFWRRAPSGAPRAFPVLRTMLRYRHLLVASAGLRPFKLALPGARGLVLLPDREVAPADQPAVLDSRGELPHHLDPQRPEDVEKPGEVPDQLQVRSDPERGPCGLFFAYTNVPCGTRTRPALPSRTRTTTRSVSSSSG